MADEQVVADNGVATEDEQEQQQQSETAATEQAGSESGNEPVKMFIPDEAVPPEPEQQEEVTGDEKAGDTNTDESEAAEDDNANDSKEDETPAVPETPGVDPDKQSSENKKIEQQGYEIANMRKTITDMGQALKDLPGQIAESLKPATPDVSKDTDEPAAAEPIKVGDLAEVFKGRDGEDFPTNAELQEILPQAIERAIGSTVEQVVAKVTAAVTSKLGVTGDSGLAGIVQDQVQSVVTRTREEELAAQRAQADAEATFSSGFAKNYPELAEAGVTPDKFLQTYRGNFKFSLSDPDQQREYEDQVLDMTKSQLLATAKPKAETPPEKKTPTQAAPPAKTGNKAKPSSQPHKSTEGTQTVDANASTRRGAVSTDAKPAMWGPD